MPATGAELGYNTSASVLAMANAIFGSGVTVTGASYSGDNNSSAIYSNGDALSPDATPGDTGVILSIGRTDRFTQSNGDPNRSTNTSGVNNDSDFNAAAGANTYDASFLEVDFTSPTAGFMTMQFVFASEEYPEYMNPLYQDMIGVWINGAQVNLTVGDGDADPSNLNASDNSNLFISNTN
ncbi:choice-of-anchor L domain-containing protein [Planktotalea sp.]|uniref:choice-of-anchor L domain-containing protein n=1 Tax=Planktotalea sp. TaxID=2029877 RepID=UPI0025D4D56A|nr:choice-of-anchor L domain-containing protein [Planktotalea sp.]